MVPGLLTVSPTEAITAWRALCSSHAVAISFDTSAFAARRKSVPESEAVQPVEEKPLGFKDGRDVYLLRFESAAMLKTGR